MCSKAIGLFIETLANSFPSLLPCRLGTCLIIPHAREYYFNKCCCHQSTVGVMALYHYITPKIRSTFKFNAGPFRLLMFAEFIKIKNFYCLENQLLISGTGGTTVSDIREEVNSRYK